MLFRRLNLKIFQKFRFASFPILITALCKGRFITLCNIKIMLIFVLVFLHKSQIRSTFFSGSRASPRVKIKKSLYLKNLNPNELKVVGAFHLTKNPGLNFRNFRMLNGTVFSTRPNRSCSIPA